MSTAAVYSWEVSTTCTAPKAGRTVAQGRPGFGTGVELVEFRLFFSRVVQIGGSPSSKTRSHEHLKDERTILNKLATR